MHRFRASLVVALLLVLSPLSSEPATAGGPTSALLSVPGQGRTASLYYTDPEYDALAGLVGITSATGTGEVDESGRRHDDGGPGVTITWLIHDVDPWRIDRVYPDGENAAWIATQTAGETGSIWDSPIVWHQPAKGSQLMALLDELGVGRAARQAGDFDGVAGAAVPPPAESGAEPVDTQPVSTEQPAAETSGSAGLWWGLGGLAAGVLLTLGGARSRRRTAPDTDAPPAPNPQGGVSEELAWPAPRG